MKLLDDLKERRRYSHLKEEVLDRTIWTARFGRCFGPVVMQTAESNNLYLQSLKLLDHVTVFISLFLTLLI